MLTRIRRRNEHNMICAVKTLFSGASFVFTTRAVSARGQVAASAGEGKCSPVDPPGAQ